MRRPAVPHTAEALLSALENSVSVRRAAESLATFPSTIAAMCSRDTKLLAAYRACIARGEKRRGQYRTVRQGCSLCHELGHDRKSCPKREEPRFCVECGTLPWRRPRNKRALCKCGGSYAPEPEITVAKLHEQPNYNRRELY